MCVAQGHNLTLESHTLPLGHLAPVKIICVSKRKLTDMGVLLPSGR